jgi:feruloyl esterase
LREIQLHKDTFDGCLAGASAQWWTHLNYATYAVNRYVNRLNSSGFLNSTDYALIGKEVLQQCDELDGVKDGIILNPRICKPDLSNLICAGAKEDGCLIKEQADTMYEIWSNRTRESTGEWLFPGFEPGSEASPAFSVTGVPYVSWLRLGARFPLETATDLVFERQGPGPDFFNYQILNRTSVQPFNVSRAELEDVLLPLADEIDKTNAIDGYIAPYLKRGKLLTYVGMADTLIPSGSTLCELPIAGAEHSLGDFNDCHWPWLNITCLQGTTSMFASLLATLRILMTLTACS